MATSGVRLKELLRQRHWQTYRTFCREYDRAAKSVDPDLVGSAPSRAQLHRWLAGEMKGMPYPDHCRVLEAMFPGWQAHQLFEPHDASILDQTRSQALPVEVGQAARGASDALDVGWPINGAEPVSVFTTRSEFASRLPPHVLFDDATTIDLAGLSLNLLCQSYAGERLRRTIDGGAHVRALFLDPSSEAIQRREREEGLQAGRLAALTEVNMEALDSVRGGLSASGRDRLEIGTYDETVRFNLILVDGQLCVAQPYLPQARGVDSPTLLMRRLESPGTVDAFQRVFNQLWERRQSR